VEEAEVNRNHSGWTTTQAAARALGVTPRTVRLYIDRGELEGKLDTSTDKRIWLVSIDSLNTLRAKRGTGGIQPEPNPEFAESVPEAMHDLAVRLENRAAEAAELRTRLELTEQSQSTIEEERNRLAKSLRQAEEEAETLRKELEAERSKGFWQRLFGA
jgi:predicted ribosome quality control (RQC) complex YloA/Tae2 family protein